MLDCVVHTQRDTASLHALNAIIKAELKKKHRKGFACTAGLHATAYAWQPQGLYIGCANGQLALLDTAAALKPQHQVQHTQGSAFAAADGHQSVSSTAFAVVGRLEWSGQAVQIEALAVNKDLVAVAGHCPAVRWAPVLLYASTQAGGCGEGTSVRCTKECTVRSP